MSGSGKGGNNRKNRQRFSQRRDDSQKYAKKHFFDDKFEKSRVGMQDRPQWTAPELPANPITTPDCSWCGKQISDIATAICDKDTGKPVHFDCVLARITQMENLQPNESISYIGGGRFGVIHYNNLPDMRDFYIKKIYEWESKDIKDEWRRPISEYFSLT
jgi:hypothetical protein